MPLRIKICCIATVAEAQAAIAAGADAIGLVASMPSGPGPISDQAIANIARRVPPAVDSFLLTSETQPEAVVDHVQRCGTSVVQLVDSVPDETYRALRENCPNVRIVQVLHVENDRALHEAQRVAPMVDSLLLDSGRPNATVPVFGGTGDTHDWSISARIVKQVPLPVFLAGGLNPANVTSAIATVRPFGVDLCTGVRIGGCLDDTLLHEFIGAARMRINGRLLL